MAAAAGFRVCLCPQTSLSLTYEPSSEPPLIAARKLLLNSGVTAKIRVRPPKTLDWGAAVVNPDPDPGTAEHFAGARATGALMSSDDVRLEACRLGCAPSLLPPTKYILIRSISLAVSHTMSEPVLGLGLRYCKRTYGCEDIHTKAQILALTVWDQNLVLTVLYLPGKWNLKSHGARPVHLIITIIKWVRTSRLAITNPLSLPSLFDGRMLTRGTLDGLNPQPYTLNP